MEVISEISIAQLELVVKSISNISDVQVEGDSVLFKFKDKDSDLMLVIANEVDDEKLVAMMPLKMSENHVIGCLVSANNWNQRRDSHDTFSYMTSINNDPFIIIESHLLLRGGVTQDNVRAWIKNLINHINPFEEQILSNISEIGEDNDLLKNSSDNIWAAITEITTTVINTWFRS